MEYVRFILPILFGIIISRYIEKKYRVANIAWSVLFFFLCIVELFTTKIPFIVNMWLNTIGEMYYSSLHEALHANASYSHGAFSAVGVYFAFTYIFLPFIVAHIVNRTIKESIRRFNVYKPIDLSEYIDEEESIYPKKDVRDTKTKIFLEYNRLTC